MRFYVPLMLSMLASAQPADLIVVNARVRLLDPKGTVAEAIAFAGERVLAKGSSAEIRGLAGPATRVIDAGGRTVMPGFNDSHTHFLSGGFQLSSVDLRSAATPAEFTARITAFATKMPKGRWITGGDWDHELWPGAPLPVREWIDAVTPDTPVFVNRLDGHMALANSRALQLAGVTKDTKDPPGGVIVRDPKTGEPTGVLKDAAMTLVYKVIPEPTPQEKLEAARAATRHAASLGVTSVQDMSAGADVGVYQQLLDRGELLTRVYAATALPDWQRLAAVGVRHAFGSSMVRIGGLKAFADGSLGSTTALFFDSYNDDTSTSGIPSDEMIPPQNMLSRIRGADKAGLQVMVHAIGDKANEQILSFFAEVARDNGPSDRRFRIEHAQHLRREGVAQFAREKVIASMQPYHAADDGRWAEKRIGAQRALGTYAFRSLLDAGVVLAFGTDWTVAPLNPFLALDAAVTRRTLDGKHPGGWIPSQKISVEEAVRAYTWGSAYAEFQEQEKGSLEPGKLADFIITSGDVFTMDPLNLGTTKVLLTVVGGRVVFEDPAGLRRQ